MVSKLETDSQSVTLIKEVSVGWTGIHCTATAAAVSLLHDSIRFYNDALLLIILPSFFKI